MKRFLEWLGRFDVQAFLGPLLGGRAKDDDRCQAFADRQIEAWDEMENEQKSSWRSTDSLPSTHSGSQRQR